MRLYGGTDTAVVESSRMQCRTADMASGTTEKFIFRKIDRTTWMTSKIQHCAEGLFRNSTCTSNKWNKIRETIAFIFQFALAYYIWIIQYFN